MQFLIQRRIVTLPKDAPIHLAGQTMCTQGIGCIMITDARGHLVGIVTDRDLACYAVGENRPPDTPISEIMTPHPLAVDSSADLLQVVHYLEESGIRRMPVIERTPEGLQKCVGLITLDDLAASKLIDYDHLSRIIQRQIQRRSGITMRHAGLSIRRTKTQQYQRPTLNHFYQKIERKTGLSDQSLIQVTEELLVAIVRRLQYTAAVHFINLIPEPLQERLLDVPIGPDHQITLATLTEDLSQRHSFSRQEASNLIKHFLEALSELLDPSIWGTLRSQLPEDLAIIAQGRHDQGQKTGAA